MLPTEDSYFKNGKVNKEALVDFIKTIKKNTNLSDEDAAIMVASRVCHFFLQAPSAMPAAAASHLWFVLMVGM